MGVAEGRTSLLVVAKQYIKQKYGKPGNVYLGVVSRLDAPVTGVVLMARTSKAAARLSRMFRGGEVEKTYWALVEGNPQPPRGGCQDWLRKHERHRRVEICGPKTTGAQEARLTYEVVERVGKRAWLQIRLLTGRKHQIRVQMAHRGWPVLGDRKYGSAVAFPAGIALHARRLQFVHPVRNEPLDLVAEVPATWRTSGGGFTKAFR
jgi:23S rRNA pseudouridine1911/1915/1917 synthase